MDITSVTVAGVIDQSVKPINRRTFAQRSLSGFGMVALLASFGSIFGSTLATTACTFRGVVNTILEYTGVGLQAFQAIVDLLAGAGVLGPIGPAIDAVIGLVKIGFADLTKSIADYNGAPTSEKPTYLQKLSTVLSVVEANIQQFWNDLNVPDAKLAGLIQGLLGIILSTLKGFAMELPVPQPTPASAKMATLSKKVSATPQRRSISKFKHDFNSELTASGFGQYAIK